MLVLRSSDVTRDMTMIWWQLLVNSQVLHCLNIKSGSSFQILLQYMISCNMLLYVQTLLRLFLVVFLE